ncbi:MAG: acyl-CoA-binding protein [Flavobacteriaceae bacterium]|nr:acyl-CoA-binding protein [Flavobacteriaceae bacterium]
MKSLEEKFEMAYQRASEINQSDLPPDIMLRLYAYYKLAVKDNPQFVSKSHKLNIRNAFKFNAWTQLKGISPNDAKQEYIKLVESITNKTIN